MKIEEQVPGEYPGRRSGWVVLGLAALLAAGPAIADTAASAKKSTTKESAGTYTFTLSNQQLQNLYPNAADPTMPAYYREQPGFPTDLKQSIQTYTQSSLQRDNIDGTVTAVVDEGSTSATVTITSQNPSAAGYATMLQSFANTGAEGWQDTQKCQQTEGCWDSSPGTAPWAFFLPLGLPVVNQQAVMFLNYPPSDSLCTSDYLNNFTMIRWSQVLATVGIADPVLYETIVDAHPIAAPGSGQSNAIAKTTDYYDDKGGYDSDLLALLTSPPGRKGNAALPLLVSGSPAQQVWGTLIGQKVKTGDVGRSTLPGQSRPISWVASNHPDVTTYQCCPGDKTKGCYDSGYKSWSDKLVPDEVEDLVDACTIKTLAENPDTDPYAARTQCQAIWRTDGTPEIQHKICVQARLDYDFTSEGQCQCQEAAEAFCTANANQACPSDTQLVSCKEYNQKYCSSNAKTSYPRCSTPGKSASGT